VIGVALGGVFAWLVERTDAPLKNVAYISAFIALAIPYVIWTIGWVLLLNPRNGLINVWLMSALKLDSAPINVFSMEGMILVDGLQSAPMAFLLAAVPLRSMDPALEEASAMSGASAWQTLSRVTLRLSAPAFIAVLLLTLVRCIEAFETPAILGIPGRVYVLTTEIYQKIRGGAFPDYNLGSAYAVLLVAIASVGIVAYHRATRHAEQFATVSGKGYQPRRTSLGWFRPMGGLTVCLMPVLILLPLAIMAWASFQPFYRLPSADALAGLTFTHYASAFSRSDVRASLQHSLIAAGTAATAAVLIAALACWLIVRTTFRGARLLDVPMSAMLAVPGVVLGVAILRAYLTFPLLPIYGTIWILAIAYVCRALPYASRYVSAGLVQIHRELEESSQTSGASWTTTFRRILVPLLMPALFGAWVWVFLSSIRELPMTLILVGPNSQVLASVIFDLWTGGQLLDMAAFSVVVTGFFVVLAFALKRVTERWGVQV
jgi:iron(III) transport system permease protein